MGSYRVVNVEVKKCENEGMRKWRNVKMNAEVKECKNEEIER